MTDKWGEVRRGLVALFWEVYFVEKQTLVPSFPSYPSVQIPILLLPFLTRSKKICSVQREILHAMFIKIKTFT